MNTNFFHNILNILIAVVAAVGAFLIATGCTALPTGHLECSSSWISPVWSGVIVSVLAVSKTLINIVRDGLSGLTKPQPPVLK